MREPSIKVDLAGGAFAAAAVALGLTASTGASSSSAVFEPLGATLVAYAVFATLLARRLARKRSTGWANRITLIRAVITCALAGALLRPELYIDQAAPIVVLVVLALALDGVDGWLARRLGECGEFGARFDMETDASLILVLCAGLWLSNLAPIWVLAIGLMRPAFLVASRFLPWLDRPLPESLRRKLICVLQVGALPIALLPFVPETPRLLLLAASLTALLVSFAVDTVWLFHHRNRSNHPEWRTP